MGNNVADRNNKQELQQIIVDFIWDQKLCTPTILNAKSSTTPANYPRTASAAGQTASTPWEHHGLEKRDIQTFFCDGGIFMNTRTD